MRAHPPRRGGGHRPAVLHGVLRLLRGGAVQRQRPRAVGSDHPGAAGVLARDMGITRAVLRSHLRISSAKVAEYQDRGLIHLHAIIRLDGPDGPGDQRPPWAVTDLLRQAILAAARIPAVRLPRPAGGGGMLTLGWGDQVDARHQLEAGVRRGYWLSVRSEAGPRARQALPSPRQEVVNGRADHTSPLAFVFARPALMGDLWNIQLHKLPGTFPRLHSIRPA